MTRLSTRNRDGSLVTPPVEEKPVAKKEEAKPKAKKEKKAKK
jgi:hypothetical protein